MSAPDLSAIRPVTHWTTVHEDVDIPSTAHYRLLVELAHVACSCTHPPEAHPLEALRLVGHGVVLEFRLGVCRVDGCRCRGGRA